MSPKEKNRQVYTVDVIRSKQSFLCIQSEVSKQHTELCGSTTKCNHCKSSGFSPYSALRLYKLYPPIFLSCKKKKDVRKGRALHLVLKANRVCGYSNLYTEGIPKPWRKFCTINIALVVNKSRVVNYRISITDHIIIWV